MGNGHGTHASAFLSEARPRCAWVMGHGTLTITGVANSHASMMSSHVLAELLCDHLGFCASVLCTVSTIKSLIRRGALPDGRCLNRNCARSRSRA